MNDAMPSSTAALPGPNRPGLIEANTIRAGTGHVVPFRGLIAPASLKQRVSDAMGSVADKPSGA